MSADTAENWFPLILIGLVLDSMAWDPAPTIVSAPGKVLIAGGYLVLDPAYPGIVLVTNARFYACVSKRTESTIRVRSPQFQHAEWLYAYQMPKEDVKDAIQAANALRLIQCGGPNPFVALALLYALHISFEYLGPTKARETLSCGLDIMIIGDNDYYSRRVNGQVPTIEELRALEPFASHPCSLGDVHKTGLGSSAAMTTSLVGALLLHLGVAQVESGQLTSTSLGLIHNVAQLAHCAAQGKVGSGFDVSASVWGHQLYRRFDPDLIKGLIRHEIGSRIVTDPNTAVNDVTPEPLALLPTLDASNPLWVPAPPPSAASTAVEGLFSLHTSNSPQYKARPAPLSLPPGIQMCLADVDTGSNTRTLVGKVSDWRAQHPDWAAQLYKIIASSNQSLADGLLQLHMAYANDQTAYTQVLETLSQLPSLDWDHYYKSHPSSTCALFLEVRNAMRSIRAGMRELGSRSGAPVEPPEMTRLLDTTINTAPGIMGGGVPGAGGYDALFLLFLSPSSVHTHIPAPAPQSVCDIWQTYSELSVGPLLCSADCSDVPCRTNKSDGSNHVTQIAQAWAQASPAMRVVQDASTVPGLERWLNSA